MVADTITGMRSTYGAEGAGATFHDNSAIDPGDTYEPIDGGTVYLAATPASGTPASDYSDFWYGNGASVLELPHAAGVSGSDIDSDRTMYWNCREARFSRSTCERTQRHDRRRQLPVHGGRVGRHRI